MRRLLLLRHAKSDWSTNAPDNERQLNPRGRAAAPRMGHYIQQEGLTPDRVLCSPATRALETWNLVKSSLDPAPQAENIEAIYDFSSGTSLLGVIKQHGGDAQTLMLIGHNPSIEGLASLLIDTGAPSLIAEMHRKYPTATLTAFEFPFDDWQDISPAKGTLTHFVRPKDVEG